MERLILAGVLLTLAMGNLWGQDTSHYPPAAEGIKAASIPGPGTYLKWYNIYYEADKLKDANGKTIPSGFDLNFFAAAPRLIWVTDHKIFGADYGFDILVPIIYTDLDIPAFGVGNSHGGIGDIYVEPFLFGWHKDRYDFVAAAGFWAPTGDYDVGNPVNAGKDFWTGMFTFGVTRYLGCEKQWSVSALSRYETNSERNSIAIRPGDDFHIEWGIGRNINKVWDVGLSGYMNWQVSDDSGADITYDRSIRDRFYTIGPEVQYFYEPASLFLQLRYQFEIDAQDRSQGRYLVFSFVKVLGKEKRCRQHCRCK